MVALLGLLVFMSCSEGGDLKSVEKECSHATIIIDDALDATCEKYGLTEGSHCADCGKIIVPQEIIQPLGHNYVFLDAVESSCIEEGKTIGLSCSRCHATLIEQECVQKKDHTKGHLISLTKDSIESIDNPALFECEECHQEYYDSVCSCDINVPVLSIYGDTDGISKENKKKITAMYSDGNQEFELNATIKLQGSSSVLLAKKNYNIQFYQDATLKTKKKIQIVDAWGKQSKYTLKANYTDASSMRNVVSAKIYGDIVRSRNIDDNYNSLVNGGAVDGFPIVLYQNGSFQGLYTLNTSKDDYLFDMKGDETTREAILMVNDWGNSGRLFEPVPDDFGDTWKLEYCSTEDDNVSWVVDSLNEMISFVNNNDGQEFLNGIDTYINVPRAIDAMLFTWAIGAKDNVSKNILWTTYNGIQWTPSVYDLDNTWGAYYNGTLSVSTDAFQPFEDNALWNKLYNNMYEDIKLRWKQLREGPLSIQNIDKHFVDFYKQIPGTLYQTNREKWSNMPCKYTNHVMQITNWAIEAFYNLDAAFGITISNKINQKVEFICDDTVKVFVYLDGDYSKDPSFTTLAYARDGDLGYLAESNGQINFKVALEDGFEIDKIEISGSYKNLKLPEETGVLDTYRITKVLSELSVVIITKRKNS